MLRSKPQKLTGTGTVKKPDVYTMPYDCETAPEIHCKSEQSEPIQYHDASGWLLEAVLTGFVFIGVSPMGLTVDSVAVDPQNNQRALWRVSGGTAGIRYTMEFEATTNAGGTRRRKFLLDVV